MRRSLEADRRAIPGGSLELARKRSGRESRSEIRQSRSHSPAIKTVPWNSAQLMQKSPATKLGPKPLFLTPTKRIQCGRFT
jgi:hypothetical protein